ncbi:hypothetical protein PVAP13_1NG064700 [Panicum virgatum]|uniref:Uncharacterized protein n=1 Tax=Panicum virgatum TaxID=38727 RepID=A0A8T0WGS3_PANVG|nr:hypothetical protein PVAP13_1NG064700 [Panicum virgatum]
MASEFVNMHAWSVIRSCCSFTLSPPPKDHLKLIVQALVVLSFDLVSMNMLERFFSGTSLAHNSVNCCGSCSKLTMNIVRILRPRLLFQTPMNMHERQLSYSQQLPSFDQNIMFYHGISISVECFVLVLHFITRQRCLLCRCFLFCL